MKAWLKFYVEKIERWDFEQKLEKDIELSENDVFEYRDEFYNLLNEENKEKFNERGLKKGKYKVFSTKIEDNEVHGKLRFLFLKPMK